MRVLPSAATPRLVIPATHPRAGASAVLRHGDASALGARLQRRALASALRAGLGRQLFRSGFQLNDADRPSVTDRLGEIMNQPVVITFALTPRRANRKPILHLLDTRGRSLAFVKIGINPLTRQLVRHERDTLEQLARVALTTIRIPEVIHSSEWNDLELLVLSALPTWEGKTPSARIISDGMLELCGVPLERGTPTGSSGGYARRLVDRANEIEPRAADDGLAVLAELRDVAEILAADPMTSQLVLAPWHGDWTPWNCRQLGTRLLVWDWERCVAGAPAGFDALHFALNQAVVGDHVPHRTAAHDCLARAHETLAPWGVGRAAAGTVAALYLVELGLRYIEDGQLAQGGFGGDVATWIVPALRDHVSARRMGRGSTA